MMLGFGVIVAWGLSGVTALSAVHELFSISALSGVLWGALIIGATGVYDDLVGVRARTKLILQICAACVAVLYGLHWPALERILGPDLVWLEPAATIVFVVAVVNAVNLMDGLDGLAGSLVAVALGGILVATTLGPSGPTNIATAWVTASALGAVLGFLLHNRHPARVFMGDGGAYFLGFLVSALAIGIEPTRWRVAPIHLSIPMLLLAVPLFDLSLALIRRVLRGQPIFCGDSDHIHHRLLAAGFSQPSAVRLIAACSLMFVTLALLNVVGVGGWWTLLGTLIAALVLVVALGYHRILARLPAFSGDEAWGWRERRRELMAVLAALEALPNDTNKTLEARWTAIVPGVGDALSRIGVPALEVWRGDELLAKHGDPALAWGHLGLPLPGDPTCQVRLHLAVRLPSLGPEVMTVIEKSVAILAGSTNMRSEGKVVVLKPDARAA